ncbi:hypothetical protein JDV09_11155 [Mycobacterium sp. Y57]|uniref:hypothetical protein n=1 Tax=Mycolicibacterium xanthum TaxID=2796469 RepID=UPI001C84C2D8|nr:hypothetical protein [Mycolicibacterium xanthum]MBX7432657.1 hypothetical protein [Mycolicibacterium xanthum]
MESPATWKVVTAGAALTGFALLGAGIANADLGDRGFSGGTQTVLAWDDTSWDDSWD